MKQKTETIVEEVIAVFRKIQEEGGHSTPESIKGNMNPFSCLDEFDSLKGVYATLELALRFQIDVPADQNLCVDDAQGRGRTFLEIAKQIEKLRNTGK